MSFSTLHNGSSPLLRFRLASISDMHIQQGFTSGIERVLATWVETKNLAIGSTDQFESIRSSKDRGRLMWSFGGKLPPRTWTQRSPELFECQILCSVSRSCVWVHTSDPRHETERSMQIYMDVFQLPNGISRIWERSLHWHYFMSQKYSLESGIGKRNMLQPNKLIIKTSNFTVLLLGSLIWDMSLRLNSDASLVE